MKNIKLLTKHYRYNEGGIETYMQMLCKFWKEPVNIFSFLESEQKSYELINNEIIKRFPKKKYSYYFILFLLIKKIVIAKDKLLLIKLFFVIMINRAGAKDLFPISLNVEKETNKNDLILASSPFYEGLQGIYLKAVKKCKVITFVHGSELNKSKLKKTQTILMNFILKNSDLVIGNSDYTVNLAKKLGAKNIHTEFLGADIETFFPIRKEGYCFLYEKYDIPKNKRVILSVSHLVARKGQDFAIKAFRKIADEFSDVVFIIAGKGEYRKELENIVRNLNLEEYVKFIGFVKNKDLNFLYNLADIFLMPSRKEGFDVEGFGIVFLEANACKTVVIAGKSGGVGNAIIDNKTGLLVNPIDENDIYLKLKKVIQNQKLKTELEENGYKRVRDVLNWEKVIERLKKRVCDVRSY